MSSRSQKRSSIDSSHRCSRKRFSTRNRPSPTSIYRFKHALTQDVAYNSVLIERRKALHLQTAQAIEQVFHDQLEDYYNVLALSL